MKTALTLFALTLTLAACGQEPATEAMTAAEVAPEPPNYAEAVANPARLEADFARDAGRMPAQVLEFFGIARGMTVLDLFAGGGTLHRIDPAIVIADMEAAGFVCESKSDVLRSLHDDYSKNVFDPAVRGKTDRFVLRFRKAG